MSNNKENSILNKTALEFFLEQITKHTWYDEEGIGHVSVNVLDIEQAKQMELEQHAVISRLSSEIKSSLFQLNEIACYYQHDKDMQNSICRELRKIHSRVDKLSTLNNL